MIPRVLVGYEMIANKAHRAELASHLIAIQQVQEE